MEKRTAIFPKLPGILLFLRQLDLLRNADHFVCFLRKKIGKIHNGRAKREPARVCLFCHTLCLSISPF